MADKNQINRLVIKNLKRLRLSKGMKMRQVAQLGRIPLSSYACMEAGHYNISIDLLFRVLGALEADIQDVWPAETVGVENESDPIYIRRIQSFRLSEVLSLTKGEGAALFAVRDGECTVLLEEALSDFMLDRLILYLEDGRQYQEGFTFERNYNNTRYCFFLKADKCPDLAQAMIHRYLTIWSNVFELF